MIWLCLWQDWPVCGVSSQRIVRTREVTEVSVTHILHSKYKNWGYTHTQHTGSAGGYIGGTGGCFGVHSSVECYVKVKSCIDIGQTTRQWTCPYSQFFNFTSSRLDIPQQYSKSSRRFNHEDINILNHLLLSLQMHFSSHKHNYELDTKNMTFKVLFTSKSWNNYLALYYRMY